MEFIAEQAKRMNAFIISDEIYERIDYNNKHQSMYKFYNKTFTINGFSKIYSICYLRINGLTLTLIYTNCTICSFYLNWRTIFCFKKYDI